MTPRPRPLDTLPPLDAATIALIRLSACITSGTEDAVRRSLDECVEARVPGPWAEELILQSYLFAGLPRALNAARARRRHAHGVVRAFEEPGAEPGTYAEVFDWRLRGETTCKTVYGENYTRLRENIRALHPNFDDWMIVEGYGKVLSRPGLDLARRELCIIAACAASGQDRQLHSHLLGALNAGALPAQVNATLDVIDGVVEPATLKRARALWERLNRSV